MTVAPGLLLRDLDQDGPYVTDADRYLLDGRMCQRCWAVSQGMIDMDAATTVCKICYPRVAAAWRATS